MKVRPAVGDDLPELLRLLAQVPLDGRVDPAPAPGRWRDILAQPGRVVLVADDGGLVGTLDLLLVPNLTHGGQPWAIIENLVVDEDRRRRRTGTALLEEAVDRARAAGCYKVQLLSNVVRDDAHELYRAAGFEALAVGFRRYL